MKKIITRIFSFIIIFVLAFTAPFSAFAGYKYNDEDIADIESYKASDCVTFDVDVKYDQENARKFLQLINDFRTSDDAWYWEYNDQGVEEKVYKTDLQPLVYNYALEKYAMQRAAEVGVYMNSNHTCPNGLGSQPAADLYFKESLGTKGECVCFVSDTNTAFNAFLEANSSRSGQGHRRAMLSCDPNSGAYYFACASATFKFYSEEGVHEYGAFVLEFADASFSQNDSGDIDNTVQSVAVESSASHILQLYSDPVELNINEHCPINSISIYARVASFPSSSYQPRMQIHPHDELLWSIEDDFIAEIVDGSIIAKHVGTTNLVTTYAGKELKVPVTVTPIDISGYTVTSEKEEVFLDDYYQNGNDKKQLEPTVTVTSPSGTVLKEGTDYTVTYTGYKTNQFGAGYANVTGIGNYTGTLQKRYLVGCNHSSTHDNDESASCLTGGHHTKACDYCQTEIENAETPALGHDYLLVSQSSPSCTEDGVTTYQCSRCDDIKTETVTALGHDYQIVSQTEPSCTEDGITVYQCTRCDDTISESNGTKLGHDYQPYEYKEPTCTENGVRIFKCTRCDESISDNYGDPLGHDYQITNKVEPSCTEEGTTTYTCSRCSDSYELTVPATGHSDFYIETTVTIEPTCTEKGSKTTVTYCSVCNEAISTRVDDVKPLGHDFSGKKERVEPTCTKAGYEVVKCRRCDTVLTTDIPATGHHWDNGVITQEPTLDAEGVKTYTCTVCGETHTESVPKLQPVTPTVKNGWLKENGKWRYYTNNVAAKGWKKVSNKWYWFDANANMATGWKKISNKWYFFNSSGAMLTGWQKLSGKWYFFNSSGAMLTGWQKLSGKWYFFNSGGDMKTGWLKSGGKWYYFNNSGVMVTGSVKIGSKTYRFNSSGVCLNP